MTLDCYKAIYKLINTVVMTHAQDAQKATSLMWLSIAHSQMLWILAIFACQIAPRTKLVITTFLQEITVFISVLTNQPSLVIIGQIQPNLSVPSVIHLALNALTIHRNLAKLV